MAFNIKDYFLPKNKKEPVRSSSVILLLVILILAAAVGIWFLVFSGVWKREIIIQNSAENKEEIARQLEELSKMKAVKPLSQEELGIQMDELSDMKAEKPLSTDETAKQLEELSNLKK